MNFKASIKCENEPSKKLFEKLKFNLIDPKNCFNESVYTLECI